MVKKIDANMDKKELTEFVAKFWEIKIEKINDDLSLDDKNLNNYSSIRFYRFIAAIESNLNVKIKNIHQIKTFADLFNNIQK